MEIKGGVAVIGKRDDVDVDVLREALVDEVELELISPREFGGERRESLTFREPSGYHVELVSKAASAKAQVEASFRILGECVGLGPEEVKGLGSRDLARMGQVLGYFLPDVRGGGI